MKFIKCPNYGDYKFYVSILKIISQRIIYMRNKDYCRKCDEIFIFFVFNLQVAAMHFDGSAVKPAKPIHFIVNPISGSTGSVATPAPVTPTNGIAEINLAITDNTITGLDIYVSNRHIFKI